MFKRSAVAAAAALSTGLAAASGPTFDVSGAVSTISGLAAPIGLVGAAILAIVVIRKAWKMLRP